MLRRLRILQTVKGFVINMSGLNGGLLQRLAGGTPEIVNNFRPINLIKDRLKIYVQNLTKLAIL